MGNKSSPELWITSGEEPKRTPTVVAQRWDALGSFLGRGWSSTGEKQGTVNVADTKRSPCREPRTDAEQMLLDMTEWSKCGLNVKAGLTQGCECLWQPKSLYIQAVGRGLGINGQWQFFLEPHSSEPCTEHLLCDGQRSVSSWDSMTVAATRSFSVLMSKMRIKINNEK